MTVHVISVEIDASRLTGYSDSFLATAWHVAQVNPARFNDPDGQRYGIPTFPWNGAWNIRPGMLTRRQLAEVGLRPGGQEPVAQLMWRSRRARARDGVRIALLYRIDLAMPRREPSAAQRAALARALAARMTCRRE